MPAEFIRTSACCFIPRLCCLISSDVSGSFSRDYLSRFQHDGRSADHRLVRPHRVSVGRQYGEVSKTSPGLDICGILVADATMFSHLLP